MSWLSTHSHRCPQTPALTFNDAPLCLPAQHTPPVHQMLSVSADHSKGDPVLWGGDKTRRLALPGMWRVKFSRWGVGLSFVGKVVEGAQDI